MLEARLSEPINYPIPKGGPNPNGWSLKWLNRIYALVILIEFKQPPTNIRNVNLRS